LLATLVDGLEAIPRISYKHKMNLYHMFEISAEIFSPGSSSSVDNVPQDH